MTNNGVPDSWRTKDIPHKITYTVWLLGCTILVFFYTSQLLSQLVSVGFERPIDSSKDVLETGVPLVLVGSDFGSTSVNYFAQHHNPIVREVFQKNVVEQNKTVEVMSTEYIDFLSRDFLAGKGISTYHITSEIKYGTQ